MTAHDWLIDCQFRYRREDKRFVCLVCGDGFTLDEFMKTPPIGRRLSVVAELVIARGGAIWKEDHIEVVPL